MADFELGQVFEGKIAGQMMRLVVINTTGDNATLAIAPDRDKLMALTYADLAGWKRIPASESDWYMEAVAANGKLLWATFIPGFEAAWAFYIAMHPDVAEAEGYIRVGAAEIASNGEMMAFDDAGGMGPEATIRQAEYRFFISRIGLPMVPPLDPDKVSALMADLPQKMDGHGSCLVKIEGAAPGPGTKILRLKDSPDKIYLMGAILYSDWDLKERWMGFCHEYVPSDFIGGDGMFVPVDNPDYEYSD